MYAFKSKKHKLLMGITIFLNTSRKSYFISLNCDHDTPKESSSMIFANNFLQTSTDLKSLLN